MNYFSWHYKTANKFILKVWGNYLLACWHFFSLGILLATLFSPWRRVVVHKEQSGFSFNLFFQNLTFNLVSRLVGFMVRLFLLFGGLFGELVLVSFGFLFFLLWQISFPLSLPIWWWQKSRQQNEAEKILNKSKDPAAILLMLLSRPIGKFVIERLGIGGKEMAGLIEESGGDSNRRGDRWVARKPNGRVTTRPYHNVSDLFLLLARDWPPFNKFLFDRKIKPEDVLIVAGWFEKLEAERKRKARFWERENLLKGPGLGKNFSFGYTPNLDKYVTDLTRPTPFFHQLVGRQKEVNKIEEILARSGQNNVLLVGPAGVGKHTIILGFARRVYTGLVRPELTHKRVLQLNLNQVIAKSSPTEAKTKLLFLLQEAVAAGNVILVIRHIDKFASPGEGRIDLTSVFAKAGETARLQLMATTTEENFARYLSPNEQFLKLFEKLPVAAPSKKEALHILMMILPDFEEGKKVKVTLQALQEIIRLSDRLITDIPFPEKAIDLLDQAISKFEHLPGKALIRAKDIDQLVSERTKVPVGAISSDEQEKLSRIEEELHKRVIDQEGAIVGLASSLRRARLAVGSPEKPMGSFLFLGPTGVGKTETAKALAEFYFGSEKRMLRFDMSQYQQQSALPALIGSPKSGPGLLTEKVKNKPFSVLLLDELEKADSRLLNIFLTVFDEGYLQDFRGKKISFADTIIIATSNAAAEFIRQQVKEGVSQEQLSSLVLEYVQKEGIFSPEFLNRFDGVIVFRPLGEPELKEIARLQLLALAARLRKKDIILQVRPALMEKVAKQSYSVEFGARPMKRLIAQKIEDEIAKGMLKGDLRRGDKIEVEWDEGEGKYLINKLKIKN